MQIGNFADGLIWMLGNLIAGADMPPHVHLQPKPHPLFGISTEA